MCGRSLSSAQTTMLGVAHTNEDLQFQQRLMHQQQALQPHAQTPNTVPHAPTDYNAASHDDRPQLPFAGCTSLGSLRAPFTLPHLTSPLPSPFFRVQATTLTLSDDIPGGLRKLVNLSLTPRPMEYLVRPARGEYTTLYSSTAPDIMMDGGAAGSGRVGNIHHACYGDGFTFSADLGLPAIGADLYGIKCLTRLNHRCFNSFGCYSGTGHALYYNRESIRPRSIFAELAAKRAEGAEEAGPPAPSYCFWCGVAVAAAGFVR